MIGLAILGYGLYSKNKTALWVGGIWFALNVAYWIAAAAKASTQAVTTTATTPAAK